MKVKVAITKEGVISFGVPQGTFETGKIGISKVIDILQKEGINFVEDTDKIKDGIEQHKHDDPEWQEQFEKRPGFHIHADGTSH